MMSGTEEQEKSDPLKNEVDLSGLDSLSLGPKWGSGEHKRGSARRDSSDRKDSGRSRSRDTVRRDRRSGGRKPAAAAQPERDRNFQPVYEVAFYPEEEPFKVLADAIHKSCKTYELFEIAKVILEKSDRFVAVMKPLPSKEENAEQKFLFLSVPDSFPFETEEQAVNHVLAHHVDKFLKKEEVEVEAPKGDFKQINKCSLTGVLLGPPNYHRYQEILKDHHATRVGNMAFEKYLTKIETLKDEESIQNWVQSMTKNTVYVGKDPESGEERKLENLDAVRHYLMTKERENCVKRLNSVRMSGANLPNLPRGDIRSSIEALLEQQRRFPLDTANNLRGRLRRMKFHLYKKGAKGVSYVCAVKRKFRDNDTVFTDSIQGLIQFLEKNAEIKVPDLPEKYLGISIPDSNEAKAEGAEVDAEQNAVLGQLMQDLRWLVTAGYVTEYGDGRLVAHPILPPQKPKAEKAEGASAPDASSSSDAEEKPEQVNVAPESTPAEAESAEKSE